MFEDAWEILNRLFIADAPFSKSQYLDKITSNKIFVPEIQLWIDVLKTTCEDWLNYKNSPTLENFKLIKDIDSWAFKDSFAINRMCETMYLAFRIEPDTFKTKFRKWLEKERYFYINSFTTFIQNEPFEVMTEEVIWYDINNKSTGDS